MLGRLQAGRRGWRWRFSEFANQSLHFSDFAHLRFDDAISQLSYARITDLGPLARHDCYGMMRDHRFHVAQIANCLLTVTLPLNGYPI